MKWVIRIGSILVAVFVGMAAYRWSAVKGAGSIPHLPIPPISLVSAVDPLPDPGADIWLVPERPEPLPEPPVPISAPPAPSPPPAPPPGGPAPAEDEGGGGVTPPPSPPAPQSDPSLWRVYTVGNKDTLGEVAQRLLGTCKRWPEILDANKGVMKTERDLRPGMKIRVPPRDLPPPRSGVAQERTEPRETPRRTAADPPADRAADRKTKAAGSERLRPVASSRKEAPRKTHVVREGETLYSLAKKFYPRARVEEAVERLRAVNGISPTSVPVGKTLTLPPLE